MAAQCTACHITLRFSSIQMICPKLATGNIPVTAKKLFSNSNLNFQLSHTDRLFEFICVSGGSCLTSLSKTSSVDWKERSR